MKCPVCATSFSNLVRVPDPMSEPGAFFDVCDIDANPALTRAELFEASKALFPVDHDRLRREFDTFFGAASTRMATAR